MKPVRHLARVSLLGALSWFSWAVPAAENLVQDAGFETPSTAGVAVYGIGQSLGAWTVSNGSVELHGDFAASGLQSVRITAGVFYQVIPTVPEASYRVTFSRFSHPRIPPEMEDLPSATAVNVGWLTSVGGTGGDVIVDEPLVGDVWESHSYTFMAHEPFSVLYFGSWGFSDAFVDDVSVTMLPEPVPCTGPGPGHKWKNHGAYVAAVSEATAKFVADGLLNEEEAEAIAAAAARSDCGKK
jgi:hypothetical protein